MSTLLTKNPVQTYLINSLYDAEYKGFYVAAEQENTIICNDKKLEDQALAILALISSKDEKNVQEVIDVFDQFYDKETNTYHELIDRYGIVHSAGMVRHSHIQLLTAYALLEAGLYLKNPKASQKGLSLLKTIHQFSVKKGAPYLLDRNLHSIINHDKFILVYAYGILAAECAYRNSLDEEYLNTINYYLEELFNFIDPINGGAFEYLLVNGTPFSSKGKKAYSHAIAAIALIKASTLLQRPEFIQLAQKMFSFVVNNYEHPLQGGYWNKSDDSGKVRVDPINSYYTNTESPFPVKLTSDQAALLICANELFSVTHDDQTGIVIKKLFYQLQSFISHKDGGVFLGQGNWFSTPVDPTVPLIRHFMVPHHTPGAFYAGNTGYLPLHQRQSKTQSLTLLALNSLEKDSYKLIEDVETKHTFNKTILEDNTFIFDLTNITYNQNTNLKIDLNAYTNWLYQTKSGSGFGLTPYRSPLGFRSDTSPQNFSALHVVSDLRVMNKTITDEEKESILRGMFACQNMDGGFGEQAGHLSEVFTTYCVVLTAHILGSDITNKESCISYLKSCQNEDGGFGNSVGYPSDIWHTNLAVLALHALGEKPYDELGCLNYTIACQHEDGGYGVQPGAPAETFSTFRAVDTILILGKQPPNHKKTIQWLQDRQVETGGFVYKPGSVESFVGSYHAIAALYILGELPKYIEECKQWLADHQAKDGGFSRSINAPSDTTDEGFICLQASYMLERNLNPYWVAIIT